MTRQTLNGTWTLISPGFGELEAEVPGSFYHTLLRYGKIDDPFYGDNEYKIRDLCRNGCEYRRTFTVDPEVLKADYAFLKFDGIDTVADLFLNGKKLGHADNMHRVWEYDVKSLLKPGENTLRLVFDALLPYLKRLDENKPVWGVDCTIPGYQHVRKAHYMMGWDWGPQLPDMGIWRDCALIFGDTARLGCVEIRQSHADGKVDISVNPAIISQHENPLTVEVTVTDPKGKTVTHTAEFLPGAQNEPVTITVENPLLWWPNGYGEQPLYTVKTVLKNGQAVLDSDEKQIGLRTVTVSTAKDKYGREFCFQVNGVKIFAMGADYIPEDNLLPRLSREKTEDLIRDCAGAHFNCLRVWGGGFYPNDWFYELCDQYGILVWQDFMFACAVYDLNREFECNITAEIVDVLKRIRHHACIGLICGNNEMEQGMVEIDSPSFKMNKNEKFLSDYLNQYERLIPELCRQFAPDIFYWPASPSSGGGLDYPNDPTRGDVHYWEAWHGGKPFEEYRKYFFRFCSEFGFESFPSMKTISSFAKPEDLNPFSYIMESHQKCIGGNKKILNYLADNYLYPKDFEMLVYTSQLLQADAIRYGVEHWRRFRGRCMGAVYWQVNDCWPVASWASRDYFGRWKALHYFAKRFFAPVLLSAHAEDYNVTLNVSNETMTPFEGDLICKVTDANLNVLYEKKQSVSVPALSSLDVTALDLAKELESSERSRLLVYTLTDQNGAILSSETLLFTKPKHFGFSDPAIGVEIGKENGEFTITLTPKAYAKGVQIDFDGFDAVLSDNFFDLTEKKTVRVVKLTGIENPSVQDLKNQIKITSVFDIS